MNTHLNAPPSLHRKDPLALGLIGAWLPGINYCGLSVLRGLSGRRINGTLTNFSGNQVKVGRFGRALNFASASSHYVEFGNVALYNFGTASFSVVVVFKSNTVDGTTRRLVVKRPPGTNPRLGWSVQIRATTGNFDCAVDDGTTTASNSPGTISTGVWYVGGMTVDRAAAVNQSYLSGFARPGASSISGLGTVSNSNEMRISSSAGTPAAFFNGEIAAVYIYNRALRDVEWLRLFADPLVMFRRPVTMLGFVAGGQAHTKSLTESLGYGDALSKGPSIVRNETLILQDARALGESKILSEQVNLTNLLTTQAGKVLVDTLAALDSMYTLTGKSLSEQLGLDDTMQKHGAKNLTELLAMADTHSLSLGKVLGEILNMTDELARTTSKVLTEGISFSDLLSAILNEGGIEHTKELTEILGMADGLQKSSAKLLEDVVAVVDVLSKEPGKDISDALGMLEFLQKSPALVKIEQLVSSDVMAKLIVMAKVENLALNDVLSKHAGITLQDILAYSDMVSAQFIQIVGLVRLLQIMMRISTLDQVLVEASRLDIVRFQKSIVTNIKFST